MGTRLTSQNEAIVRRGLSKKIREGRAREQNSAEPSPARPRYPYADANASWSELVVATHLGTYSSSLLYLHDHGLLHQADWEVIWEVISSRFKAQTACKCISDRNKTTARRPGLDTIADDGREGRILVGTGIGEARGQIMLHAQRGEEKKARGAWRPFLVAFSSGPNSTEAPSVPDLLIYCKRIHLRWAK